MALCRPLPRTSKFVAFLRAFSFLTSPAATRRLGVDMLLASSHSNAQFSKVSQLAFPVSARLNDETLRVAPIIPNHGD